MHKFTAVIFAAGLALFAASSARAGDFSGVYVGADAGGATAASNAQTSTVYSGTGYFAASSVPAIATAGNQALSTKGFTGSGLVGYNFQWGHFVAGAEADYGAMHLTEGTTTTANYPCCAGTGFTITQTVRTRWLFTARPKIGIASHRVMLYVTGGAARTHLNYFQTFTDTFAAAGESSFVRQNITGWIAGGGLEIRLLDHLSIKGEYLHADFGRYNNISQNLTTGSTTYSTNIFTNYFDLHTNIARAGFNYRF